MEKMKRKWLSKKKGNTDSIAWEVSVNKDWSDAWMRLMNGSEGVYIDLSLYGKEKFNFEKVDRLIGQLEDLRHQMYLADDEVKAQKKS